LTETQSCIKVIFAKDVMRLDVIQYYCCIEKTQQAEGERVHHSYEAYTGTGSERFRANHKLRELLVMLENTSLHVSKEDAYGDLAEALENKFPSPFFCKSPPNMMEIVVEAICQDLLGFDWLSHSFCLSEVAKQLLKKTDIIRCACGASMVRYWRGGDSPHVFCHYCGSVM